MTAPPGRAVRLDADLLLELDDRPVTIRADGQQVVVQVADVAAALAVLGDIPRAAGLPHVPTRAVVRRLAETVARAGLTVTVAGPDGVLVTAGRDATPGRLVRVLSGSEHVAVGRRGLRPLVRPALVIASRRLTATRILRSARSLLAGRRI